MSRTCPRIVIFDSGVGGLSVFTEIRRQLPGCELIFASDTAGFPYGTRGETDLIDRVGKVVEHLIGRHQPDIMVIACNSASTVVLPVIRSRFQIPFVGVVPAIKPAAALSRSRSVGLLATPATVSRPYTHKLIQDFAADCRIIPLGSSELVYMAEEKLKGKAVKLDQLKTIIAPLFADQIQPPVDTVVLACTHFPLLQKELEQAAPYALNWIDSSPAIARRVQSLLEGRGFPDGPARQHLAVFTGMAPLHPGLRQALRELGIEHTENLDI